MGPGPRQVVAVFECQDPLCFVVISGYREARHKIIKNGISFFYYYFCCVEVKY